ncbi:hypothetical protein [Sphingomonas bacterium]|uniref:hypothetical protein n=1 Tax=Sphingomonas bacterium TaxID=1895847 RepID=UPI001C2DB335|nr:hypothetical protein [Sphingomonas bacterium]
MTRSPLILIIVVSLVTGFGAGYWFHRTPGTSAPSVLIQPTEDEATAAVRRHKVGFMTFPEATLILGDCAPATLTAGVNCMTQMVLQKGSSPQNRSVGFARVNGQWEVSLW